MTELVCWMCREAPATTGEHKWPAAYLRRIPDEWKDLQHGKWEGEVMHTQGVKSKNLKLFVLCARCNNVVSQQQDRALDAFLIRTAEWQEESIYSSSVVIDHSPGEHDPLDLYRALLKLEFSRLYSDGLEVPEAVADFVSGGDDWRAANERVRIEFRMVVNLLDMGLMYPSGTDADRYKPQTFIAHQINFGWLGIHFVTAEGERPDLDWPEWPMLRAPLSQCTLFPNGTVHPPF